MKQPILMLVEADVVVRHPLAEYLRDCGYRVIEAMNVDEARSIADKDGQKIDLVMIDAISTAESGFALAGWLRQSFPQIKVTITGSPTRAVKEASHICHEGPTPTKPYDHQIVLEHIKRLLAARDRGAS